MSFLAVSLLVFAGCDDVTRPEVSSPIQASQFSQVLSPTITDLGTLGGLTSFGKGINNQGQVVGSSDVPSGEDHAFLWAPEDGMIDLGTLGGPTSRAEAINDLGQVVGTSQTADRFNRGFIWSAEEGMVDLGTLGGLGRVEAHGINNLGQVVGFAGNPGSERAFLWTKEDGMVDIGGLGGKFTRHFAFGINDLGQVVGQSSLQFCCGSSAFLWTAEEGMIDLGTLGGNFPGSAAVDINEVGQAVGVTTVFPFGGHTFLWTAASGMVDLGTLGGTSSSAFGINDLGQVVGISTLTPSSGALHLFFWTAADGMIDLTTLTGLAPAPGEHMLNNLGQVVATITTAANHQHAALLTLVPANLPPAAAAGPDQTVEWTSGGVSVTLDGTGSSDPDEDPLTFSWTDANDVVVGTGPTPTIDLGSLGSHTITLTVNDGQATDTDDVVIDVVDTTPPNIFVALVPAPDPDDDDDDEVDVDDDEGHFRVEFSCSDACDTNPTITSAMLNGIAVTNGQIVKLELEDDDDEQEVEFHHGILEIEASSFALTVTCVDASGNEATATAVPQFADDDDDDDDDDEYDDDDDDDDDRKRRRRRG